MFKDFTKKMTRFGTKVGVKVVEHLPAIMFVGGVIGFGATIYFSIDAAPKVNEALEDHNDNIKEARAYAADPTVTDYTETDLQKDIRHYYVNTFFRVLKITAKPVATGLITLGLFGGAQFIVVRRLGVMTSEYLILDESFKKYRKNVVDDQGEEKDREYFYSEKKYHVTNVEPADENGVEKITEEDVVTVDEDPKNVWVYSAETAPYCYQGIELYDDTHINSVEKILTDDLERKGLLTRNDILFKLGLREYVRAHRFTGNMFGKVFDDNKDNTFKFNVEKVWVPNYKTGKKELKYYISYDEEILYGNGRKD